MEREKHIQHVIAKLTEFYDSLAKGERMKFDISNLMKAKVFLNDLKEENENLLKQLCDKEDLIREAEGRVQELEIQLCSQKSKAQGSWIMAEDAPPKDFGYYLVTVLDLGTYKYQTSIAKWRGHMFTAEDPALGKNVCVIAWLPKDANPAPLVPTFKDIFLKRFPQTETVDDRPALCVHTIFPYVKLCDFTKKIEPKCKECWNQPYFEEKKRSKK